MAQRNYECMFLLHSGRYAQDPQGTENELMDMLAKCEAEIVGATPWQDGKLAYEVDGHRKGLHFLTYFKMDGSQVVNLNRMCKLSEIVIRHLMIEHSDKLFELMTQQVAGQDEAAEGEEQNEEATAEA